MPPAKTDIADMQCWVFRLAKRKWGLDPAECSRIFRENGVLGFIADSYGILHVSSYESALADVERYLGSRGVAVCCRCPTTPRSDDSDAVSPFARQAAGVVPVACLKAAVNVDWWR